MTDSTPNPSRPPRKVFSIPEATVREVSAWAEERGITDNAAFCLLIRSGLIHAVHRNDWLPHQVTIRGSELVRRSIALPDDVLAVLVAWAGHHGMARDVAATVLTVASLQHSSQFGLTLPALPLDLPYPARNRTAYPEEDAMTTTTTYGSWVQYVPAGGYDPADYVRTALGDFADGYHLDALEQAFRAKLAELLPEGVILAGDQFIGPVAPADPIAALEGPGFTTIVQEAIEGIDFWALVAEHAKPEEA